MCIVGQGQFFVWFYFGYYIQQVEIFNGCCGFFNVQWIVDFGVQYLIVVVNVQNMFIMVNMCFQVDVLFLGVEMCQIGDCVFVIGDQDQVGIIGQGVVGFNDVYGYIRFCCQWIQIVKVCNLVQVWYSDFGFVVFVVCYVYYVFSRQFLCLVKLW